MMSAGRRPRVCDAIAVNELQPAARVRSDQYLLTLSCPDKRGIVHAVSSYLFMTGCNIVDSQQFGDQDTGLFFMRVHFSAEPPATADKLRASFAAVADSFGMDWQIHPADHRMRIVIMVSKFGHCLNDLLFRSRTAALPVEIAAVVSNHTDFEELVGSYGISFYHIPVTRDTKPQAEAALLDLVEAENVELVVLARYMQVISDDLCKKLTGRIINIHHSFLPSFKGAKPYHQAHARGVKLIGATAHYVTAELDAGPIIEQEVARIDHRATVEDMRRVGRYVERQVLAQAVTWHVEDRVIVEGPRTIVFA
jgi:formyltetrahydrofolate deformylase